MDYSRILFDPIYAAFGLPATLTPNRTEATGIAVTVIERTSAADPSEQFELGTLRPGAFVRRRQLDDAGVAPVELDGGSLSFGGRSWRIDAHAPKPGPDGETSGEILMYLVEDADG